MKKYLFLEILLIATIFISCSKPAKNDLSLIEDISTVQSFLDEPISDDDIVRIVNSGMNAQSAINRQPWHFSIVTNREVLNGVSEKMKSNMPPKKRPDNADAGVPPVNMGPKAGMGDSPLAIVVSAKDGSEFDAGLATELMAVEAVMLGYGTKIISSPTIVLNGPEKAEYKKILGIPEDMSAKAILLVGKADKSNTEANSGATSRKTAGEVISFIR